MDYSDASILLVDDEPILLELFEHFLKAFGIRDVYKASDGVEALAVLKAETIDLLITDVRMPVMDGITLVRQLGVIGRELPSIIFVSGFGDLNRREMYMLGVEAFIAKPFDREELFGAIRTALAERSALWQTAMTVEPRQSVLFRAADLGEMANASGICLGRGGFTACTTEQLSLGKIAFRCLLSEQELRGQGYVRWYSRTEEKVGIEFAYLDSSCRTWLVDKLALAQPRSFIPGC